MRAMPTPRTASSAPSSVSSIRACRGAIRRAAERELLAFPVEEYMRQRAAAAPPGASPAGRPPAAPPAESGVRPLQSRPLRRQALAAPDPALGPDADPARRAERGHPHRAADRDRHQPASHCAASVERGGAHAAARDGAPVAGGDRPAGGSRAAVPARRRGRWVWFRARSGRPRSAEVLVEEVRQALVDDLGRRLDRSIGRMEVVIGVLHRQQRRGHSRIQQSPVQAI